MLKSMAKMELRVPQGKGAVSGMVSGIFRNFGPIVLNGEMAYWSMIDSCVKCWQYFPTQITSWNSVSMSNWPFYDIGLVRFKIEVGVENVTQHTQHSDCQCHSSSKAGHSLGLRLGLIMLRFWVVCQIRPGTHLSQSVYQILTAYSFALLENKTELTHDSNLAPNERVGI